MNRVLVKAWRMVAAVGTAARLAFGRNGGSFNKSLVSLRQPRLNSLQLLRTAYEHALRLRHAAKGARDDLADRIGAVRYGPEQKIVGKPALVRQGLHLPDIEPEAVLEQRNGTRVRAQSFGDRDRLQKLFHHESTHGRVGAGAFHHGFG